MTRAAGASRLFEKPCAFVAGAPSPRELPAPGMPEIAFAGRSNCGKSSLINALVGPARPGPAPRARRPAHAEHHPVRSGGAPAPGRPAGLRLRQGGARRGPALARNRRGLSRNPRHAAAGLSPDRRPAGPHGERPLDVRPAGWRGGRLPVVFTKCDKLGAGALEAAVEAAGREIRRRPAACGEILALSARTGRGIDALRLDLAALAGRPGLA